MSLTCDCDSHGYDRWFIPSEDFSTLDTMRVRKCPSCERKIPVGGDALPLFCYRAPRSDYEERRFGDEVPMSTRYFCEECAEIYLTLSAIGYCLNMGTDMKEALREYWQKTGFDPKRYESQEQPK